MQNPPRNGQGDRAKRGGEVWLSPNAGIVPRARRLRAEMSLPEVLLWLALRLRPGGLKFRRQHPAGPFVMDFFCAEARLAVEIDGASHDMGFNPERDIERELYLSTHGIRTLRLAARDVLANVSAAVEAILSAVSAPSPLHHATGGSPPRAGEDLEKSSPLRGGGGTADGGVLRPGAIL